MGTEEHAAQAVVHADNVMAVLVEITYDFRTDQFAVPYYQGLPALQRVPLRPTFPKKLRCFRGRSPERFGRFQFWFSRVDRAVKAFTENIIPSQ